MVSACNAQGACSHPAELRHVRIQENDGSRVYSDRQSLLQG